MKKCCLADDAKELNSIPKTTPGEESIVVDAVKRLSDVAEIWQRCGLAACLVDPSFACVAPQRFDAHEDCEKNPLLGHNVAEVLVRWVAVHQMHSCYGGPNVWRHLLL